MIEGGTTIWGPGAAPLGSVEGVVGGFGLVGVVGGFGFVTAAKDSPAEVYDSVAKTKFVSTPFSKSSFLMNNS
jgi:hypothetical protein